MTAPVAAPAPRKKAYNSTYWAANRDKLRADHARWVAENQEHIKKYRRNYYDNLRVIRVEDRFRMLAINAAKRGVAMALTLEQYSKLVAADECSYCGFGLPKAGSGLDRIDSTRGYEPGNVTPCCKDCNYAKHETFSASAMARHVGPAIRAAKEEAIVGLLVFVQQFWPEVVQ